MLTVFFLRLRRWLAALFQPLPLIAGLNAGWGVLPLQNLTLITGLGTGTLIGFGLARWLFVGTHTAPPIQDTSFVEKETLALQETKEMYAHLMSAVAALANKATSLLANSGLLLTLFGILQIALIAPGQPVWYQVGLVLIIALYALTLGLLLAVLAPHDYRMAFVADWDGVDNAIRRHSPEGAITQLLANYLARIQHNDAIHHRNIVLYKWALRFFALIVALQVALSLFAQR